MGEFISHFFIFILENFKINIDCQFNTEVMSAKKITKVGGDSGHTEKPQPQPKPQSTNTNTAYQVPDKDKAEAKKMRFIAVAAWVLALGMEIGAILVLRHAPVSMFWLITLIILDLAFAVTGSIFWKKSNKLDPASESEKVRYMIQNQLGAIVAMIVFLPLVILIFTNKNLSPKQKGIAGSIGAVALLIAGYIGIDFDPTSLEQLEEKNRIEQTTETDEQTTTDDSNAEYDGNSVYWTKSGKSYHLFSDCSYINGERTDEIFQGTPLQAKELKNITDICDRCQRQYDKSLEQIVEGD